MLQDETLSSSWLAIGRNLSNNLNIAGEK